MLKRCVMSKNLNSWCHGYLSYYPLLNDFHLLKYPVRFIVGTCCWLIDCFGFNDTSALVGHFVSFPREREKRDSRDSRGDESVGQNSKRKMHGSKETEVTMLPLCSYLLQGPVVIQYQFDPLVTQNTRHLCLPYYPRWYLLKLYMKLRRHVRR